MLFYVKASIYCIILPENSSFYASFLGGKVEILNKDYIRTYQIYLYEINLQVSVEVERLTRVQIRFNSNVHKISYRVFTVLFINFQWVIFKLDDLSDGLQFIKRMVIHNVDYGKVLILWDSYEQVTEPFIALGVSDVDPLELRN